MRAGLHHAHGSQRLVAGQFWGRVDGVMVYKSIEECFLEKGGSSCFCWHWQRLGCPTGNLLWAEHNELALRIWGFWDSCRKGLVVQQGRMEISNEVQAGLAATVLQVLGSSPGDAGPCLPCSTANCQASSPCQPCRRVMPWFSLKLFILSPLLCLFCPVVKILRRLWEGGDLPVHQTTSPLWSQLQGAHETAHWSLGPLGFLPRHYFEGEHRLFI